MEKNDEHLPEAAQIVCDLARRFLKKHGTEFTQGSEPGGRLLTASELIDRYATVQMEFRKYRAAAKPDPNWLLRKFGVSHTRTIKDDRGAVIGKMLIDRVGFFVNEHHRDLFQAKYFNLTAVLDKVEEIGARAFLDKGWTHDAMQLKSNEPVAYEQLSYYVGSVA